AFVVAGSGVTARFAAFVTLRMAKPICLGIQQPVQCLLHAAPDDTVEVVLNPLIVNCDDIAQWTRCNLSHGGSLLAVLVAFSHLQFSQIRGRQPLLICAKDSVRHPLRSCANFVTSSSTRSASSTLS